MKSREGGQEGPGMGMIIIDGWRDGGREDSGAFSGLFHFA